LLGLWFIVSCIAQLPSSLAKRMFAFDFANIVPRWTFFAPTPGTSDYRVVFRDRSTADELWQPFRELPLYQAGSNWRCFWNPGKLHSKIISDLVPLLLRDVLARQNESRAVMLTWTYMTVLEYVSNQPPNGACIRQFAVFESTGCDAPRHLNLLFVSQEHQL
jgi:hypothetical protein